MNDLDLLEALFRDLDRSPFYVKDADLRYRAANPAMARLCGRASPSELHGRRVEDFFRRDDISRYEALDRAVIESGQSNPIMIDHVEGPDPSWLVFSQHPLLDRSGQTVGVAGTSTRLEQRDTKNPVYRRVLAISEDVRLDPGAPHNLTTLARSAHISASQLSRDFKQVFKVPLLRFVNIVRLTAARKLLSGDASISEVAQQVGFVDHSAFTRSFKAQFGLTPRAFRKDQVNGSSPTVPPSGRSRNV